MIISADTRIPFPRPLVYATYRDELVELVPYLPDVQRIEVKSRREEGGLISKKIEPNLLQVSKGVRYYLEQSYKTT